MLLLLIASMDIASILTIFKNFSYLPLFYGSVAAKDLGPGAIIGVVCHQRCRFVAYLACIFKALGITLAWGLCGMHPGLARTSRKALHDHLGGSQDSTQSSKFTKSKQTWRHMVYFVTLHLNQVYAGFSHYILSYF